MANKRKIIVYVHGKKYNVSSWLGRYLARRRAKSKYARYEDLDELNEYLKKKGFR